VFQKARPRNSRKSASLEGGTPVSSPAADALRRCHGCLGLYPITEFRRRGPNRKTCYHQCRACHNLAERKRRAIARGKASRRRVAEIIGRLRPDDPDRRAVALCDEMVRHLGGVNGAVQAWLKCMNYDLERGGMAAMRHINLIFRLMAHCEPETVDYSQMSDEDLRQAALALGIDPDA
jgi:hypothetical protein